jgi:flagellar biogenesis protein FliO
VISPAFAADQSFFASPEAYQTMGSSNVISFGYIIQLIFSLAVVLGFIFIIYKYVLPKFKISTTGNYIKVVDKVILEPQVSAYILKAGKSAWLIAVTGKQVTKIDKLEEGFENLK